MSDKKDIQKEIKEMRAAILAACEHRGWNPYMLNEAQLAEIITDVLGEPIDIAESIRQKITTFVA